MVCAVASTATGDDKLKEPSSSSSSDDKHGLVFLDIQHGDKQIGRMTFKVHEATCWCPLFAALV